MDEKNEKCFCHLNGYVVKDATARNNIEELKITIGDIDSVLDNIIAIQEALIGGDS